MQVLRIIHVLLLLTAGIGASIAVDPPAMAAGWRIDLVAQTPEIRYPSAVCVAPDGRIFLAEDPMDIREDVAPSATAGRILCLHPDGRRTVFAEQLHAVFGLQYLEGHVYALHNPRLTRWRDADGVGVEARDLLTHTLIEPWGQGWNDHVPANFKLGIDGWFYLAIGDKGLVGCTGSDGRTLDLRGGGIARFRPDGSGLELFASGVRNILDVALTAEDELFTYDNTDEHQWMGRFTHMVEAGFYGYPYDFIPRRPYTLWMLHDFGAGAACGTLCATDAALAPNMDGNVFIADFGKRQVTRVALARDGASWRMADSQPLFTAPPDDFRPVGLTWMPDGRSFLLCDWQHRDAKSNREVGRLWRVTWTGAGAVAERPTWWQPLALGRTHRVTTAALIDGLAHPALSVRLTAQRGLVARGDAATLTALRTVLNTPNAPAHARRHALWALDGCDAAVSARRDVVALAAGSDSGLAAQALRQLSQRLVAEAVPVATQQLAHADATVRLQAATLLGRVATTPAVAAQVIRRLGEESDPTVRYALFTALGRIGERDARVWPEVVAGFGSPLAAVRDGCAFALRTVWAQPLIPLLRDRAITDARAAAVLIAMIHREAPVNGDWWIYHPASSDAPARATPWSGTGQALAATRVVLVTATDAAARCVAAGALGMARDQASLVALRERLASDSAVSVRAAALTALVQMQDQATAPVIATLLRAPATDHTLRLAAIAAAPAFAPRLTDELCALLSNEQQPAERLALITALRTAKAPAARDPLLRALHDGPGSEKIAALAALLAYGDPALVPEFIAAFTGSTDDAVRRAALAALATVPDERAVPAFLAVLGSSDPTMSDNARSGLAKLGPAALPQIAAALDTLAPAVRGLLREVFKDNPAVVAHPLFAQLGGSDVDSYRIFALNNAGDPWRGQQVFYGSAGISCVACHQVAGHGGLLGPDLTLAGRQFPKAELIDSILYPSRAIREGYRQWMVITTDGGVHLGALKLDTPAGVTLADAAGQTIQVPRARIAEAKAQAKSLMPDGLHAPLTHEQFADLVAYLISRTSDPRSEPAPVLPQGFVPLFNGRDLSGWRMSDQNRTHWAVKDGRLEHDGVESDLWSEGDFGDADVLIEWRWPDAPKLTDFPLIDAAGRQRDEVMRVLDAGDSGLYLRGMTKAQANLFCYPVGSGEFWEWREDSTQPPGFARSVTPTRRADLPLGDWNRMELTLRANHVAITLNGHAIIDTSLPGLPARGPLGFQHEHGRIHLRTVAIRELSGR